MAPAQRALQIDAPAELEKLDNGQPVPVLAGGPVAAHAAIVADMRIATHAEARALLQGSSLPGGTDAGGGTATIAALLDRLSASMPSSVGITSQRSGGAGADLDCALFAEGARVRRLLGTSDAHKPGESAGPTSAMGLDVPIRCLAAVPHAALPAPGRQTFQPASDQATQVAGMQFRPMIEGWVMAHSVWVMALAGSALALVVFGLVARARAHDTIPRCARDKAPEHRWR